MINPNKQKLQQYLIKFGKNKSWDELAEQFNLTPETARHTYRRLKKNSNILIPEVITKLSSEETNVQNYVAELENTIVSIVEDLNKGTAEKTSSTSEEVKSLSDLIRVCQIDTSIWNIDKYIQNKWGENYQVKAFLSKKTQEQLEISNFQNFLETYKSSYEPLRLNNKIVNESYSSPVSLVLSLCDFHIGKLDKDIVPIETRIDLYKKTIDNLLFKTYSVHNIEEIVFIIGNDFFQTDTISGTTVKGTKVEENINWHNSYEIGFDLLVQTIEKLTQFCNKLKLVLIPGNHSESKEYYLTHALQVYFKKNKKILFDRSADKYKCHVFGETALFLNHGDNIQDKLPLMFAQSFSKEWGQTKYHEIILGDRHHNSEKKMISSQGEAQGVRMRILPSLTNIDQWHYDNLFTNSIQAGIALVYDKTKGKCSEFEHRI